MAEPLAVDPSRLSVAGVELVGLKFPAPPAPIAVAGSDAMSAAINATMPGIESLVSDGLPGVTAALAKTASSMATAADIYTKADQSLSDGLMPGQSDSGDQMLQAGALVMPATRMLVAPVGAAAQVDTVVGEQAGELAPQVAATVPQLVQLAPQMVQQVSPIAQTISQSAQQAASAGSQGSGAPAQLVSDTQPAESEDKEQSEAEPAEGALAGAQALEAAPVDGAAGAAGGNSPGSPLAAPI